MNKEFDQLKESVNEYLEGEMSVTDESFKKIYNDFLKYCIQNNILDINIGHYNLNINPQSLTVNYRNNSIYIEMSNNDIYEEYEIIDNCYYYIIKNKENDYNEESPVIRITNKIIKSSPLYSENLYFEFLNANGENISDYLNKKNDLNIEKDNYATVYKYFDIDDERLDEQPYLNMKKVMLVSHQKNGQYKPTYKTDKIKYKKLIPNLDKKEKTIKKLYELLLDFYQKYI